MKGKPTLDNGDSQVINQSVRAVFIALVALGLISLSVLCLSATGGLSFKIFKTLSGGG